MSLLDDLKQQADSLRQKQQVTQEKMNQNLLISHGKLKDALTLLGGAFRVAQRDQARDSAFLLSGRRVEIRDHRQAAQAQVSAGERGDPANSFIVNINSMLKR